MIKPFIFLDFECEEKENNFKNISSRSITFSIKSLIEAYDKYMCSRRGNFVTMSNNRNNRMWRAVETS